MGWLVASATFILMSLFLAHSKDTVFWLRVSGVCLLLAALMMALAYGTTP